MSNRQNCMTKFDAKHSAIAMTSTPHVPPPFHPILKQICVVLLDFLDWSEFEGTMKTHVEEE